MTQATDGTAAASVAEAEQQPSLLDRIRPFFSGELAIGALIGLTLVVLAIGHSGFQGYDPMQGNLLERFKPPGTEGHWLGTDNLGRDMWSRVIEGLPWSMAAAICASLIAGSIGTVLGLIAAENEGWPRTVVRQAVDTVLSFPGLVVAIVVLAVVGQGFAPLVLTLGLLSWPVFTRVIFAEAMSLLKRDYVMAARLLGASRISVLFGHVIPGLRPTLLVMVAFHFATMLIAESALSFLGIGAPLGVPTWGNMLAESRQFLYQAPWMLYVPAAAIVSCVVTANLIGDGIAVLSRRKGRGVDL